MPPGFAWKLLTLVKEKEKNIIIILHSFIARQQRYDVVLVDTAGRMQDNEPLMVSLAKV